MISGSESPSFDDRTEVSSRRVQTAAMNGMHRVQDMMAAERGAVMAEYGLLIAVIALALTALLLTFGDSISAIFIRTNNALDNGGVTP